MLYLFIVEEANQIAECDWRHDSSKSQDGITKNLFFDSMFECCDLWTSSVELSDYINFLEWLFGEMYDAIHNFGVIERRMSAVTAG